MLQLTKIVKQKE